MDRLCSGCRDSIVGGSLYLSLGNYQAISQSAEMAVDPDTIKLAEINKMVDGLAEKMKNNPDDAQGWLMLGRSYKVLEQFPKAADAFANAYRLLGDQAEIMLLYADALAYANNKIWQENLQNWYLKPWPWSQTI